MKRFEFDKEKSDKILVKHGIDFIDKQRLWNDSDIFEIPAKTTDETRYLVIGNIDGLIWSGAITYRNANIINDYFCQKIEERGGRDL